MTLYFCTYFDRNYLNKGLALYSSLEEWVGNFRLFVLCLDSMTYRVLNGLDLEKVTPITLEQLEKSDPRLLIAKKNRTAIEYYFTLTPALPIYIFDSFPSVDLLTYLDSDLYLFRNPAPVFEELGDSSIGIIGHRFTPSLKKRELYGVYNVGWISYRRDKDHSFKCLTWWFERCLEWCHDRLEDGKYADQKYLDHWPEMFSGVKVLEHKGANLAPWNLGKYKISLVNNTIMVDDQELIFFHFHGLRKKTSWLYNPSMHPYGNSIHSLPIVKVMIFESYIRKLQFIDRQLLSMIPDFSYHPAGIRQNMGKAKFYSRHIMSILAGLVLRRYIICR
jgi:hypothetical protein